MSGFSTEDAIRRTLTRYCQYCDDGRFGEFAQLWTDDAVFTVPGRGDIRGRAEITAFMEKAQSPERRGKHLCSNSIIDVGDDGSAGAVSDYVFVGRTADGGLAITSAGRYDDRLVLVDGDWLFASRRIYFLSPG